ncbi:MAG: AraC family transcriptional regulator [Lachnospiraceae bacterium]|nr:AraC family transcriptional regulator [Lachnospiraceae bacterium]
MKYLDYKEHREHGTFNFPIAFYHQTPYGPRYHMTCHWHSQCEIMHILSGSFHLTLNSDTRTYHAGDVIFITGGMLHSGYPEDNTCIYDCIIFDLQVLMKENHACSKTISDFMNHKLIVYKLLSESSPLILPLIDQLSEVLSGMQTGYEFMTQGCLYQLFGIILKEHLYEENVDDTANYGRLTSIKNVLAYISENYYNNISLNDLARIAGMNPKYFCRYFRSMTERTPIDYLNYYRIECAGEMLSTKNISIREAAISCGFNNESYFIKIFHKYKGITPKQFTKVKFEI